MNENRRKALEILNSAMPAGARTRGVVVLLRLEVSTLQRSRRDFASEGKAWIVLKAATA